jgi:hypothetical protein
VTCDTNKTDCHDIIEILLKVAVSIITHNPLKERGREREITVIL